MERPSYSESSLQRSVFITDFVVLVSWWRFRCFQMPGVIPRHFLRLKSVKPASPSIHQERTGRGYLIIIHSLQCFAHRVQAFRMLCLDTNAHLIPEAFLTQILDSLHSLSVKPCLRTKNGSPLEREKYYRR